MLLGGTWEETVCDPVEFHATFTFPDSIDADDLQHKLCEEARNNDTAYIEEILKAVDMEKLLQEVGLHGDLVFLEHLRQKFFLPSLQNNLTFLFQSTYRHSNVYVYTLEHGIHRWKEIGTAMKYVRQVSLIAVHKVIC